MTRATVKLVVGSFEISEWFTYEVENDIMTPADAFSMCAPNRGGVLAGKIQQFDTARVIIDGSVVLDGFVDEVRYSIGSNGPQVEISGRDKFGHMVDCSAEPKTYKLVDLGTLARLLGAPWVTMWKVNAAVKAHSWVKIEPAESRLDVLLRIAKKDRVLVWLDASGVGVIGRPSYTTVPAHEVHLHVGSLSMLNNVWAPQVSMSWKDIFSAITVLGSSGNSAGSWGKTALQKQTSSDTSILATRPLIVHDGDVKSMAQAKSRAEDDIRRRAFESTKLTFSCNGFYTSTGVRFAPDQMVSVSDDLSGASGAYWLSRVKFSGNEAGQTSEIELHPPGWMAS